MSTYSLSRRLGAGVLAALTGVVTAVGLALPAQAATAPPVSPWNTSWSTSALNFVRFSASSPSYWSQDRCGGTGFNCTNYVAYRLIQNGAPNFVNGCHTGSNAASWDERAARCNIAVNQVPAPGAVIQWDGGAPMPSGGSYTSAGHVAYIDAVSADGRTVYISEASCGLRQGHRTTLSWPIRGLSNGSVAVLHPRDLAAPPTTTQPPANPAAAADPTIQRTPDGAIYVVAGGAKYHLSPADYEVLGRPTWTNISAATAASYGTVPADNTFLRDKASGATYQVMGGAKYHVSPGEYAALGSPVAINVPLAFVNGLTDVPQRLTFMRNASDGAVYQVVGGAKHHLSPTEYAALGSPRYHNAPAGFINRASRTVPVDNTFLRDSATMAVYQIVGGARYHLSGPEYAALGRPPYADAPAGFITKAGTVPTTPTFMRVPERAHAVYQVIGGARVHLSPGEYAALGTPDAVNVPAGFADMAGATVPAGTWYLRESTSPYAIYQVTGGTKRHLSPAEYANLGSPKTSDVPLRWLDLIPSA